MQNLRLKVQKYHKIKFGTSLKSYVAVRGGIILNDSSSNSDAWTRMLAYLEKNPTIITVFLPKIMGVQAKNSA